MSVDPSTPVLIGVGQHAERIGQPGYRGLSPVELAAQAARAALADAQATAGDAGLASRLDTVAGVRQFEISTPVAVAPLGRSDNYPRSVARRLGADPARAILEVSGGQGPQHLITELAGEIAAGRSELALVFGSEAISTVRNLAGADDKPDFTEHVGGQLEDRGYGLTGLSSKYAREHGLRNAITQYSLFENARRGRLGLGSDEYAKLMGELFAPFTEVAAANPYASAPVARSAEELVTATERNRYVSDPYTRMIVARDQVNQGAAVLIASVATARTLGVPEQRWVYLHGHADLREQVLLDRDDLSAYPAAVSAVRHALVQAEVGLDDIATFDLYSCFPIAVFAVCDGIGLATDDPRGLTLTGGLPFFGGAGNNYSMHAVAETVGRLRQRPGAVGLVGANGGALSKYSAAVYSTTPRAWQAIDDAAAQAQIDALPSPAVVEQADGRAVVETYTVDPGRPGKVGPTVIVVGRLAADGSRFLARTRPDDAATVAALRAGELLGRQVDVVSEGGRNYLTI